MDTRHSGFETWRGAACFANGLSEEAASMLFRWGGTFVLHLVNGRDVIVDEQDVVIWRRTAPRTTDAPDDINFVRVSAGPCDPSAAALGGPLSPIRFGVDDVEGAQRLDVRVEADLRRMAVVISLSTQKSDDEEMGGIFERRLREPAQA